MVVTLEAPDSSSRWKTTCSAFWVASAWQAYENPELPYEEWNLNRLVDKTKDFISIN